MPDNRAVTHALEVAPSWGKRLTGIEGLRGIAAATVMAHHVEQHIGDAGGRLELILTTLGQGLTLFFALSGFLLFRPFATAIIADRALPVIDRFFANRALRIIPAYVVILLLVSLVIGGAYTDVIRPGEQADAANTAEGVGYLFDWKLLVDATMLQTLFPSTLRTGIGVGWSLTVEIIFYLALPVLAVLAYRARRRIPAVVCAIAPAAALLVIGVVGKLWLNHLLMAAPAAERFSLQWGGTWTAVFARSFLVHADLFAFGMIVAVVVALIESGRLSITCGPALRWGGLIVGAVVAQLGRNSIWEDTGFAILAAAVIAFVVLPTRRGEQGSTARVLEWIPFRYVGLVSYSFYLWHIPVIWVLDRWGLTAGTSTAGLAINMVLVFLVTLALSSATYFGIEKQALRLKRRTDTTSPTAPAPATPAAGAAPRHAAQDR